VLLGREYADSIRAEGENSSQKAEYMPASYPVLAIWNFVLASEGGSIHAGSSIIASPKDEVSIREYCFYNYSTRLRLENLI